MLDCDGYHNILLGPLHCGWYPSKIRPMDRTGWYGEWQRRRDDCAQARSHRPDAANGILQTLRETYGNHEFEARGWPVSSASWIAGSQHRECPDGGSQWKDTITKRQASGTPCYVSTHDCPGDFTPRQGHTEIRNERGCFTIQVLAQHVCFNAVASAAVTDLARSTLRPTQEDIVTTSSQRLRPNTDSTRKFGVISCDGQTLSPLSCQTQVAIWT